MFQKTLKKKRAKTLTVANQTEVPIVHYVSMTCFTEVNHQNRSFKIEFALANIKYKILGAPFFKKKIQNIAFKQNIMTYRTTSKTSNKNTFFNIHRKRLPFYFIHLYHQM